MKNLFLVLALWCGSALANPAPVTSVVVNGKTILADQNQMTVYTFDPDQANISNCNGGCAVEWPPVLVDANLAPPAPYGVVTRKDGSHQLSYKTQPLYLFDEDKKPGDILGDGDDNIWHIVVL